MTDRAHIRLVNSVWTFQRGFDGANGSFRGEDGRMTDVAKAPIGYQIGNDKLVTATETVDDTTAGGEPITERPGWTVEVDGSACSRTITIRDKTAQEISDEKDAVLVDLDVASRTELYALAVIVKGGLALMLDMINEERANRQPPQNPINLSQFTNAFEAAESNITMNQFKNYLKDRIG